MVGSLSQIEGTTNGHHVALERQARRPQPEGQHHGRPGGCTGGSDAQSYPCWSPTMGLRLCFPLWAWDLAGNVRLQVDNRVDAINGRPRSELSTVTWRASTHAGHLVEGAEPHSPPRARSSGNPVGGTRRMGAP